MTLPTEIRRAAFTLIELLLVLLLVGVAVGVALPYFVNSIRGNRLRAAGRTLVTVTRYTRSMAVLKQADVALIFDLDQGRIEAAASNAALPAFGRVLEGVRLEELTVAGAAPVQEGTVAIPFYRSGVCRPFEAKIVDVHGGKLAVKVDALADVQVVQE